MDITTAARGRPGERLPSCAHPRGLPGHGMPSTASRSAAHSPAVKDRSTYSGAERSARGCGDTLSPRGPPAYARDVSGTRVRRLFPGTPRACDHGPPAPKPVWHTLRPVLAARPWERSWLVHTARPGLDAGVLRQYIPNVCVVWALGPRHPTALPSQRRGDRSADGGTARDLWATARARVQPSATARRQRLAAPTRVGTGGPRRQGARQGQGVLRRPCPQALGKRARTDGRTAVTSGASASCLSGQQWHVRGAGKGCTRWRPGGPHWPSPVTGRRPRGPAGDRRRRSDDDSADHRHA
jgi:hypothetical protein